MTVKDTKSPNMLINQEGMSQDANMSVRPFGQNAAAEIAYKKVERLVLATYLVTNFVPENESVRENIRNLCQQMLPMVMTLREGFQSTGANAVANISAQVRQVLSLLDVVHASGYVSDMNLEVLKYAYADFAHFLEKSQKGSSSETLELTEGDFTPIPNESHGQKKVVTDKKLKDILKDTETVTDNKVKTSSEIKETNQSVRSKRRVTSRRMAILDVVTKKSPVHIKDIAKEVSDCSEKSIQRELSSLIADQVVKREGAKRWTVYSLVV